MEWAVLKTFSILGVEMLVCFDLDGTLEDSRTDMVAAIQQVRSDLGLDPRTYERLVPWVSKGMPKLYANGFDDVDETIRTEIPKLYAEAYAQIITRRTCLYDGIHQMLQVLSGTVAMAVVTNKPEGLSRLLLQQLGVLDCFITVIGGDTFSFAKPNPGMLKGAMERSGLTGPCIMVGDSAGDIHMAQAFGAIAVWCEWGYYDRPVDVQPDCTVKEPFEVTDIVESMLTED